MVTQQGQDPAKLDQARARETPYRLRAKLLHHERAVDDNAGNEREPDVDAARERFRIHYARVQRAYRLALLAADDGVHPLALQIHQRGGRPSKELDDFCDHAALGKIVVTDDPEVARRDVLDAGAEVPVWSEVALVPLRQQRRVGGARGGNDFGRGVGRCVVGDENGDIFLQPCQLHAQRFQQQRKVVRTVVRGDDDGQQR